MSIATPPPTTPSVTASSSSPWPLHRFTVAEYQRFVQIGAFGADDPIELLEGWVVEKMPKNPPHDGMIDVVLAVLNAVVPAGWYVRVQNTLVTADSVPEPDLAIVRGAGRDYLRRHPQGSDAALVIEVADSSVGRDREKRRLYARAGVPAFWIINVEADCLEVYSDPATVQGEYRYSKRLVAGDVVQFTISEFGTVELPVAELLPLMT